LYININIEKKEKIKTYKYNKLVKNYILINVVYKEKKNKHFKLIT